MFHSRHVDRDSARFREAGGAAFATLKGAIAGVRGGTRPDVRAHDSWRDPVLLEQWSLVHGLATLAMEGQFGPNPAGPRLIKAIRSALELGALAISKAGEAHA